MYACVYCTIFYAYFLLLIYFLLKYCIFLYNIYFLLEYFHVSKWFLFSICLRVWNWYTKSNGCLLYIMLKMRLLLKRCSKKMFILCVYIYAIHVQNIATCSLCVLMHIMTFNTDAARAVELSTDAVLKRPRDANRYANYLSISKPSVPSYISRNLTSNIGYTCLSYRLLE